MSILLRLAVFASIFVLRSTSTMYFAQSFHFSDNLLEATVFARLLCSYIFSVDHLHKYTHVV